MKDIYKNPVFYYILIPLAAVVWPLLIWGVFLPNSERSLEREMVQYEDARKVMLEILPLDPARAGLADSRNSAAEFDYASVAVATANMCKISSDPVISSGLIITTGGQKSQSAKVLLKEVDITKFAKFLSTIQLRWANLQCTKVKLTKKKDLLDTWDVDLDFKYYF